jgi:hypothetical protein
MSVSSEWATWNLVLHLHLFLDEERVPFLPFSLVSFLCFS